MKKLSIILILLVMATSIYAQNRYISKTGHIWFYSKTPLETIEAHNNQVATIIDTKNNAIAFDVLQKSFKFERALMEEHFNENYMESDKYPKCTFKGKFSDAQPVDFSTNGVYSTTVEGDMKMHGVSKHIKQPGTVEVKDGKL
ncbi:MAG: YceI family protein, partial [FCB group bacterium]